MTDNSLTTSASFFKELFNNLLSLNNCVSASITSRSGTRSALFFVIAVFKLLSEDSTIILAVLTLALRDWSK